MWVEIFVLTVAEDKIKLSELRRSCVSWFEVPWNSMLTNSVDVLGL